MFDEVKECIYRTITGGIQGYMIGSVIGVLSNRPSYSNMHHSGKKYMTIGMVYAGSECIIERIRKKQDVLNSIAAGGIVGGLTCYKHGKMPFLTGVAALSAYSGLANMYRPKQ